MVAHGRRDRAAQQINRAVERFNVIDRHGVLEDRLGLTGPLVRSVVACTVSRNELGPDLVRYQVWIDLNESREQLARCLESSSPSPAGSSVKRNQCRCATTYATSTGTPPSGDMAARHSRAASASSCLSRISAASPDSPYRSIRRLSTANLGSGSTSDSHPGSACIVQHDDNAAGRLAVGPEGRGAADVLLLLFYAGP